MARSTEVIEDFNTSEDKIVVKALGTSAPSLSSKTSGKDVIWSDGDNFSLTLKGVRERTNNERENPTTLEGHENIMPESNLPWLTLSEGLMIGAASRAEEIKGLDELGALSNHKRPDSSNYSTVIVDLEKNLMASAMFMVNRLLTMIIGRNCSAVV